MNSPYINKLRSKKKQKNDSERTDFDNIVNSICTHKKSEIEDENYLNSIDISNSDFDDSNTCNISSKNDSNVCSKVTNDPLVEKMNQLSLDVTDKELTWKLFESNRGGYKLCSLAYTYTVDKPKLADVLLAKKIYWKCTHVGCRGRGTSDGLVPPFKLTQVHNNHEPEPAKIEKLQSIKAIKDQAVNSNDYPRFIIRKTQSQMSNECVSMLKRDAMRQIINRERSKVALSGFNARSLEQLVIPDFLVNTYKNKKFYYYDSGSLDKNRIIIFTTEDNLRLLSQYKDWYADGTFDISPTLFKQVYSIHIIINETALPMLYALLPNKKQTTYKKLFRVVLGLGVSVPNSMNVDFEMAAINAIKLIFKCKVNACYFHLCQSIWRKIQKTGLVKNWFDDKFRLSFRRLQALVFIPISDVHLALDYIKQNSSNSFSTILDYFEKNYIGRAGGKPRFEMELWNLFERVKNNIPRTNNDVESWHSRLKYDARQNLTVAKVVELFRLEQSYMESGLVSLFNGDVIKKTKKRQVEKNEKLKRIISNYDSNTLKLHLDGLANLFIHK
ncbi:hypothetical protein BpHYR1_017597 [Brachionus plicatilis]|uniref:Uncharacterized protein n=1 Tax=Brachionus plicatilis TaxID=10195 RepID=A0A3M7PCZ4_BRAPC|nr:hypothetical protein BpHYR1_017597 [Brachionus plicatilis]